MSPELGGWIGLLLLLVSLGFASQDLFKGAYFLLLVGFYLMSQATKKKG